MEDLKKEEGISKTFGELTDDDYVYVVYKLEVPKVLKLRSHTILRKENGGKDIKIIGVTDKDDFIQNSDKLKGYETDKYIVTTDKNYISNYIYKEEIESYINKIRSNISKIRMLNYESETFCDAVDQLIKMLKIEQL